MPKFFSNTIPLSATKFSDFAEKVLKKNAAAQQPVVKTASVNEVVKEAKKCKKDKEEEKDDEKKPCCKKPCMAEVEVEVVKEAKKDGGSDEAESSGQLKVEPLHQKGESVKPSAVNDGNKKVEVGGTKEKVEKKEDKKEDKEAAVKSGKFIRLAKLDGTTRAWLKEYWSNLYPPEYVEFMLAEK